MSRPTQIRIDLNALKHNCQLVKATAPDSQIVAAIKADAYGHGSVEVARTLQSEVARFAVSCLEEARHIREEGIDVPLLLLEGCFSADEYTTCETLGIDVVVHCETQVAHLEAVTLCQPIHIWLKIDTGMHRLGVMPKHALALWARLSAIPHVTVSTLMTHFASADEIKNELNARQLHRFMAVKQDIHEASPDAIFSTSLANSAALMSIPQSCGDFVRPGIMLYGLSPFNGTHAIADQLKPVMTFQSSVIAVRDIEPGEYVGYGNTWQAQRHSRIATIAAGYGDGYPRNAKSGTPILINGQRAKLAGRVSMDMITADVTDLKEINIGDEVELWGQNLNANEVAHWSDSSSYELVTRMPTRTPKTFLG
ncbi:alanine racemase [Aestuariibacter sp. AA17]|uniref:Alanine racemase n=1 Tax=Fluctibacter corallii TaxID=2984329 RepID=A0ABT3A5H5_9ALTE|nr:alanine racemase [Aestuariibacter sp. AA17]MCV2883932.1 alanine racemase [Aestuariibacter sp. AA17]